MEIRQTRAADWKALRRLRLVALADAPGAFASTLEAELAFGDDVWRQRAGDDPDVTESLLRLALGPGGGAGPGRAAPRRPGPRSARP